MRSSSIGRQPCDSRAQSALFGVRLLGSDANIASISPRSRPTDCATRMNATRRSTSRA